MSALPAPLRASLWAGVLLLAVAWCGRRAEAADLEVKPALSVSEEFDDNVYETQNDKKAVFTTLARPGAAVTYRTPFLNLDTNYALEYRHYAGDIHSDEAINNLDLKGTAELLDHFLYLDVNDSLHRAAVNVAQNLAAQSLLVQQSNQNIGSVSPYLLWRIGEKGTLKTGYRYNDIRYWDGIGIDQREHDAFAQFNREISSRLSLQAGYSFARGDNALMNYNRHDLSGGFKYSYADNCSIFGNIGNSWQKFSGGTGTNNPLGNSSQAFSGGGSTSNLLWDAGITHDFGTVVAALETSVQNAVDPLTISTRQLSYTGHLDRQFERGGVSLLGSYSEYYITQTGKLEQRSVAGTLTGHYEILPRLSASSSANVYRYSEGTPSGLPYQLTGSAGFNYGFHNEDTALSLVYTYLSDRYEIGSTRGAIVGNRLVLEIRTLF